MDNYLFYKKDICLKQIIKICIICKSSICKIINKCYNKCNCGDYMEQERIAELIKKIRKDNNLTQKQLADKYNVTYQAVSKWENGINLPDISLLKKMSKDFNISMDDIFESNYSKKNRSKKNIGILMIVVIILILAGNILVIYNKDNDFKFKTLSTTCEDFSISGSIAYNKNKSSIYITNIKYCGGDDTRLYKKIDCMLYEVNGDVEKKVSSYNYDDGKIKLEEYLQTVTITVDDYKKSCKEYSENSLYLLVNATDNKDIVTSYKIPLKLEDSCSK